MPATLNILLADDSKHEHLLFAHTVRGVDNDVKISTVLNGVDLLKTLTKAKEALPDMLFLDLNMPLKNGKESLAEIRKNPKLADLYVIIYSTSDEKKDIDETFALGANAYIRKPQDYTDLEKTIGKLFAMYRENGASRLPRSKFVFSFPG